ncbi:response regulator transcription factor [Amycolatopsis sp. FBCC-B4732]|uniref:response regulator transcription factor n=1 Tax=Amycolatopsis sp. FBCC-B4732 TaxID=3079339 RepID=UPI001FF15380|nr:response regulator transcription factor [Amycolatopsis sp. FBCC-B4732]UOX89056.1 response regulator transcription factor [Amycolatopsis sp. FBCC-B4732]
MAVVGKPEVPPGAHRRLVDALHEVYLRAGAPGVRVIAQQGGVSRDTAHRVLASAALPTWPALEAVVSALDGDIGRFRALWAEARRPQGPLAAEPPAEPVADASFPVRLVIVEDHPLYLHAIVQLMHSAGHTVVGTAGSGEEAVSVALDTRPDLILMDHGLRGMTGIDAAARIRSADPAIRVLIVTAWATAELTLEALRAGAQGVLSKDADADAIVRAIETVVRGEVAVPAEFAAVPVIAAERQAAQHQLTPQELRVLQAVAEGLTDDEIADRLSLSLRTVRRFLELIRGKTGERRRAGLVRLAVESGLVRPRPGAGGLGGAGG